MKTVRSDCTNELWFLCRRISSQKGYIQPHLIIISFTKLPPTVTV